ncbi:AMP-binding protein [Marinicrinis lubricantis]|uniref:AMP-binding protein n=1 Tax=Marinicrinis lubricantis TaxID=2086470 RepID=A0ABW1IQZ3_9BACL
MSFWHIDDVIGNSAVIEQAESQAWSYADLSRSSSDLKRQLSFQIKSLGFVFCRNTFGALVGYLAGLQSGHTITLLDASMHDRLREQLIKEYRPEWLWLPKDSSLPAHYRIQGDAFGYMLMLRNESSRPEAPEIHPDLALLLSTSGTTGSPKMVRLSYHNLQANTESIATYLEIASSERPITTLPMQYSYGLSVINSHLLHHATLLMTEANLVSKSFWDFFREHGATSLAGVPYVYQMLHRLNFERMCKSLPTLRTMTQAGGRLDEKLQHYFADIAYANQLRFFTMYGQTEATARISYVPYDKIKEGIGSIGIPIPGGTLEIDKESGELVYSGPNVMMGYASNRADLAKEDELKGRLLTGDIARKGENGFYYIVGRKKRFIKVLGLRINLDEVERLAEQTNGEACYCMGDDTNLVIVIRNETSRQKIKTMLTEVYHLHPSVFRIAVLEDIPRLTTGKVDYHALYERVRE